MTRPLFDFFDLRRLSPRDIDVHRLGDVACPGRCDWLPVFSAVLKVLLAYAATFKTHENVRRLGGRSNENGTRHRIHGVASVSLISARPPAQVGQPSERIAVAKLEPGVNVGSNQRHLGGSNDQD
jgi:hypothetical protein